MKFRFGRRLGKATVFLPLLVSLCMHGISLYDAIYISLIKVKLVSSGDKKIFEFVIDVIKIAERVARLTMLVDGPFLLIVLKLC